MLIFDTICALSTPPYKGALAVIRLSGNKAKEILTHITRRDVSRLVPNQSYFTKLYKDKENLSTFIDEAVMTYYENPKSYTGFDSVDFTIHGNMIIAEELLQTLISYGARRAEKGEFSAQAYFNGKMDLLKAEGINDLINARSKRAKDIAANTLKGENTKVINELKDHLLDLLAKLEYYVENSYEDKDDYSEEMREIASLLSDEIQKNEREIELAKRSNKEYEGFQIAIAGEPNVGKSTLLNAILGEDKAIVSPIPGTTRDVIEGEKEIDGLLFKFKDTAGLRKTEDIVENLGIERSYKTMKNADLILLVSDIGFAEIDADKELQETLKDKKVIKIGTKRDLRPDFNEGDISICSLEDDLTPLIQMIKEKLDLNDKEQSAFLGKREEDFLIRIGDEMRYAYNAIEDTDMIDIASDSIRTVINSINEMIGNSKGQTMEDIYQTLFSKFCLGK